MKNLLLAVVSASLTLVVGAQVLYSLPDRVRREVVPSTALRLHPYQEVDTRCAVHWKLRPGYDDGDVMVSSDGYRDGPERPYEADIVALGDSCTFGIGEGYTGSLEAYTGLTVVNGGVEGYSARNLVCRLPDYKSLNPRITLIYIGWNDLYNDGPQVSKIGIVRLLTRAAGYASERWGGPKVLRWYPETVSYVVYPRAELNAVIDGMESVGSRVALVTLPGLFRTSITPSKWALSIGHLPAWTDNAYVLAARSEGWNEYLRRLGAERGLQVLDAARDWPHWETDFIDSVHLTPDAQRRLGVWLGERL